MYSEYLSQEEIQEAVIADKEIEGSMSVTANRYPFRFVLFDNFREAYEFVGFLTKVRHCRFFSVTDWCDSEYVDSMITQSDLSGKILNYLDSQDPEKDLVLSPFSEIARFYPQNHFDSLVSTLKAKQASLDGQKNRQRVYIPVVGQGGKFARFHADSSMFVWYCKTGDSDGLCKLLLTYATNYEVSHLETIGSVVNTVKDWLELWRKQEFHPSVICTSPSIFSNVEYAQPDNAFTIVQCDNVYDFLTKGLGVKLNELTYEKEDDEYWRKLAKEIDIRNFSIEDFFNRHFHIYSLEDYEVFLKAWFDHKDDFDRWLLKKYYLYKFCNNGYICMVLNRMSELQDRDLMSGLLLDIFNSDNPSIFREEREVCLSLIREKDIVLPIETENVLQEDLTKMANESSPKETLPYITASTTVEKRLIIEWMKSGSITIDDVQNCFEDVWHYMQKSTGVMDKDLAWLLEYIDRYKFAKLKASSEIDEIFGDNRPSPSQFKLWYEELPTVPTVLNNRKDIDVYYWIDGLGVDWIPYIQWLLSKENGMYLNEVSIARAKYPTTTEVNRPILEDVAGGKENLKKIGSLDEYAHKPTKYPDSIIGEIEIVKKAVRQIVNEYAGKKIAILSDHGLTALAQYCERVPLSGYKPNHQGRLALKTTGSLKSGEDYLIAESLQSICALNHHSLCDKTNLGQSAHGGCTPEEVLVPVLIVSSEKNSNNYAVTQITRNLQGLSPVEFEIVGVNGVDMPQLVHNGKVYGMHLKNGSRYESDPIAPSAGTNKVVLQIGSFKKEFVIIMNAGLEEDDMGI